jgi:hypothetical protein
MFSQKNQRERYRPGGGLRTWRPDSYPYIYGRESVRSVFGLEPIPRSELPL